MIYQPIIDSPSQQLGIRRYSSSHLELAFRLREPSHTSDVGLLDAETGSTAQLCFTFLDLGTGAAGAGAGGVV